VQKHVGCLLEYGSLGLVCTIASLFRCNGSSLQLSISVLHRSVDDCMSYKQIKQFSALGMGVLVQLSKGKRIPISVMTHQTQDE